jgi:hypothetical protein
MTTKKRLSADEIMRAHRLETIGLEDPYLLNQIRAVQRELGASPNGKALAAAKLKVEQLIASATTRWEALEEAYEAAERAMRKGLN